jgi:hypothetical protein
MDNFENFNAVFAKSRGYMKLKKNQIGLKLFYVSLRLTALHRYDLGFKPFLVPITSVRTERDIS